MHQKPSVRDARKAGGSSQKSGSTAFTRNPERKWTCLVCQHPKCTGDGCEARQPVARVGTYTCEQCLYSPCHTCMTTPRSRSTKYRVTYMPQWVCSACASPGQPGASEKHVKCEHCSQTLPLDAYSTVMRRDPHRKWTCLACQHPKCTGDGCEARQPMARVGTYTCEQCLFPPCHKCMTTPRPRSTKYRVTHLPQWVCSACASPGQPGAS